MFSKIKKIILIDDEQSEIEFIEQAIFDIYDFNSLKYPQVVRIKCLKDLEVLLKRRKFDFCILACFYMDKSHKDYGILAKLRKYYPSLPVLVCTSSQDNALPITVIRHGADMFLNKDPNILTFSKYLSSAIIQTYEHRRSISHEIARKNVDFQLPYSKELNNEIFHAVQRKRDRILISGDLGTGKTSLAHYLANLFCETHSIEKNIVYVDCEQYSQSALEKLFLFHECSDQNDEIELNIFEKAIDGVLILDNIHSLPNYIQNLFYSYTNKYSFNNKSEDIFDKIKFIFTTKLIIYKESESSIFIESIINREIALISIQSYNYTDLKNVFNCYD
ncbi:sigma 54-interacting transcriptional regulator [Fluviispira vulneris]|uniref:sigma 54-interacting transcriptional regulator n=1 Tax=Fluviispira vulneris TaxID=2763012 RepID=UPI001648228F|nr:sigma 54-interacting transcriptional regulator [Fluviispira vulneris]